MNNRNICKLEEQLFNRTNEILLNDSEKIVVIAWIEFDERNILERKTKMGVWTQTLKQKLGWLHAARVSVSSVYYGGNALPDAGMSFVNP